MPFSSWKGMRACIGLIEKLVWPLYIMGCLNCLIIHEQKQHATWANTSLHQSDQMARLFFIIVPFKTKKICQSSYKMLPNAE